MNTSNRYLFSELILKQIYFFPVRRMLYNRFAKTVGNVRNWSTRILFQDKFAVKPVIFCRFLARSINSWISIALTVVYSLQVPLSIYCLIADCFPLTQPDI